MHIIIQGYSAHIMNLLDMNCIMYRLLCGESLLRRQGKDGAEACLVRRPEGIGQGGYRRSGEGEGGHRWIRGGAARCTFGLRAGRRGLHFVAPLVPRLGPG